MGKDIGKKIDLRKNGGQNHQKKIPEDNGYQKTVEKEKFGLDFVDECKQVFFHRVNVTCITKRLSFWVVMIVVPIDDSPWEISFCFIGERFDIGFGKDFDAFAEAFAFKFKTGDAVTDDLHRQIQAD